MSEEENIEKKLSNPPSKPTTKEARESKTKLLATPAIEYHKLMIDTLKPYELGRGKRFETYQSMSDDDLERFTLCFGDFGDDPFIAPITGRNNIVAVKRTADEKVPIFADNWHTDWSFQKNPPAGTCLFGIEIPPVGGDTLFANQHKALDEIPADLRSKLDGKLAIHSAALPYSPSGGYGDKDREMGRSMDIRASDEALAKQLHPIIRNHPETGREGIFGTFGYIIGIDGMENQEAMKLLLELAGWQGQEQFQYQHKWKKDMLVMWDNRSVLHKATGGYQGHDRLLHRTTIAAYQA